MTKTPIEQLTSKIDEHLNKTGVVLVGMHHEIQEQKKRVAGTHAAVEALAARSDATVADLRARAEAAMIDLAQIEATVRRLTALAGDAEGAVRSAEDGYAAAKVTFATQWDDFRSSATGLIALAQTEFEASVSGAREEFAASNREVVASIGAAFAAAQEAYVSALDQMRGNLADQLQRQEQILGTAEREFAAIADQHLHRGEAMVGAVQKAFDAALERVQEATGEQVRLQEQMLDAAKQEFAVTTEQQATRSQWLLDAAVKAFADDLEQLGRQYADGVAAQERLLGEAKEEFLAATNRLTERSNMGVREAERTFAAGISQVESRLTEQVEANTRLLKESHDSLLARQVESDRQLTLLREAVEAHQAREARLAKVTRTTVISLLGVCLAVGLYVAARLL